MRIALIQTPVEDFYSTYQRTYPLGLTCLAGAVRDLPVEIKILDLLTAHGRQTISLPDPFKKIKPFLPYDHSPISAFHTYYHFGLSWKDIEELFLNELFDVYALSSNFYTYSGEVLQTASIIKKYNAEAIVVAGGQNVGPEHPLFTASADIDFCITGEGEYPFRELIVSLLDKKAVTEIKGMWNSESHQWNEKSPPFDFRSKPAACLLPSDRYKINGQAAVMVATSRGCPMGCRFCSVSRTFGKKLRLKPVHEIINEMTAAYKRGIRAFDIEDDNFTFDKTQCTELLEKIHKTFKGSIKLYAMNGLSAEHLDENTIDLLVRSGMSQLNLSIASGSEKTLKKLHRDTCIDHFKNISQYAAAAGMKVTGHFIAGLPEQSLTEILLTMRLLADLPLILGISPFYFIPGMQMNVPNIPDHYKNARLSRFWPADKFLDELDLITLFRLSRWINYLKGQLSLKNFDKINFKDIANFFSNDPYLFNLVRNKTIIGIDSEDKFFSHRVSPDVINSFFDIFEYTDVYSDQYKTET